jgi:flagellar biosynthesis anti-sigma factor FlgM
MVNFIERNQPAGIKAYTGQRSRFLSKDKPAGSSSSSNACEDRVLLSPRAREIQMANSQLQTIADVQIDKVAEIKNQIAQGEYRVSSDKIAHHLLGETLLNELL